MKSLHIDFQNTLGAIRPEIYGHFTEHIGGVFYDGLWVGEDSPIENILGFRKSLIEDLKRIRPSVLRWPGGCFAETYDWRDGVGPRESRPTRAGWWFYHDHRTESNQVGTHEFMDLCHLVGAQPYFAANMTTVSPLHIRNWVEYCNLPAGLTALSSERSKNGHPDPFNVSYWGIGNENWGGGGQMTPEWCAREYSRFSTVLPSLGCDLKLMICGPNGADFNWTRRLLAEWKRCSGESKIYGLSMHYYCGYPQMDPLHFTEDEWYTQLFKAGYIAQVMDGHLAAMHEFDPKGDIQLVVDEWGCWHREGTGPSKGYNLFEQQSTMLDAVVAALSLNEFNNRCDRVAMTNIAQLCNNLHCLFLAGGENYIKTPTYYVYDLYKGHQGATQHPVINGCGELHREGFHAMNTVSASASVDADGFLTLTLANLSVTDSQEVTLGGLGRKVSGCGEWSVLSSADPHSHNTFEHPDAVKSVSTPISFADGDSLTLPAASVCCLRIKLD